MDDQAVTVAAQLAKHFEGLADQREDGQVYPYLDPVAIPTQGRGHRVPSLQNPPWTLDHTEVVFRQDVALYVGIARKLAPQLTGDALGAIADFCYNLGPTRFKASTLRKRLREGNWPAARREIVKWVWAGGHKLPGLIRRRHLEAAYLHPAQPDKAGSTETKKP